MKSQSYERVVSNGSADTMPLFFAHRFAQVPYKPVTIKMLILPVFFTGAALLTKNPATEHGGGSFLWEKNNYSGQLSGDIWRTLPQFGFAFEFVAK